MLIYCGNLSIITQIFEFENIVYWKYTLITESWWLQVVDSRGMTLIQKENYKRKFLNSQDFFKLSNIFFLQLTLCRALESLPTSLADLCLMKKVEAPFIDEDSDFRWIFNLESFWIPSHVDHVEHSAEERVREEIFFSFPRLHVACQVSW